MPSSTSLHHPFEFVANDGSSPQQLSLVLFELANPDFNKNLLGFNSSFPLLQSNSCSVCYHTGDQPSAHHLHCAFIHQPSLSI
ncbi:hypothetical protein SLEP1_g3210 [Rubroshorea leprosula]|uniref:Uncharacterized protein n=1 Tax=Rubroshorea leprosula TaxID=152421 RepID=A0AAV5HK29_9ROSI|nr:hypothetical protein SLEP1_g3210 [Rubroshorea leprosula]